MIPNPLSASDEVRVGYNAAWLLAFYEETPDGKLADKPALEISSADYYADIHASLPGDLSGGVYTFAVEGLTDKHYATISQAGEPKVRAVHLYLYWRDAQLGLSTFVPAVADFTDTFSSVKEKDVAQYLVAKLRVVGVTRKAARHRYVTTVTARERVFDIVDRARCLVGDKDHPPIDARDVGPALTELLRRTAGFEAGADFFFYAPTPSGICPPPARKAPRENERTLPTNQTTRRLLEALGRRLEGESGRYGRGMFLIRDGVLHVGQRPIPFAPEGKTARPKPLTVRGGLIETEALPAVLTDPNFSTCTGAAPPRRAQFRLTLKGRPDLKPGDTVLIEPPPEDPPQTAGGPLNALEDALTGPILPTLGDDKLKDPVQLYLTSVEHRLGRTSSFVTTVVGVQLGSDEEIPEDSKWDCHTRVEGWAGRARFTEATPESEVARAVGEVARDALSALALAEVGEVRKMTGDADPRQTLLVWRGLEPGAGEANPARVLDVARPTSGPAPNTPYVTPFAWGPCGLVLPRYPGTRVLVTHRLGNNDDPIDVGALWQTPQAPKSQPGDWWLTLPAEVPAADRAGFADDQAKPAAYNGKVTQDLIDADGNRVIEVGELTLRVTRNKLGKPGKRAERGKPADSVTIEHADGEASIVIDSNGGIVIKGKSIQLDAGSGNITLKAGKVDVQ
jgi:hypothetical protein